MNNSKKETEMYRAFSVISPSSALCSDNIAMRKIKDTMQCGKSKLIIGTDKPCTNNQLTLCSVEGVFTNKSLADELAEYALKRLKEKHIPLADEYKHTHISELTLMYLLEHSCCYITKKKGGKFTGVNRATRNTMYLYAPDIKSKPEVEKMCKTVGAYLYENEYEQITKGGIRAYSIEESSNGKISRKKMTVNPHNSIVCPCFVLNMYIQKLIAALRKSELIIQYKENGAVSAYIVGLEYEFINHYFSGRYEEICKGLYCPDIGVINLPVIDSNGNPEVKAINMFMVERILKNKLKIYGI